MDIESGKTTGWTVETLKIHMEAITQASARFDVERDRRYEERWKSEERFQLERDRRLTEVAIEREKALKIKETADLSALQLAREIQTYKDEKANNLRTQIEGERGTYPTRTEITSQMREIRAEIQPAVDYVKGQGGPRALTGPMVVGVAAGALTILTLLGAVVALLMRTPR